MLKSHLIKDTVSEMSIAEWHWQGTWRLGGHWEASRIEHAVAFSGDMVVSILESIDDANKLKQAKYHLRQWCLHFDGDGDTDMNTGENSGYQNERNDDDQI